MLVITAASAALAMRHSSLALLRELDPGPTEIMDAAVDPRTCPVDKAYPVLVGVDDHRVEIHLEPLLRLAPELITPLRRDTREREAERAPAGGAADLDRLAAGEKAAS